MYNGLIIEEMLRNAKMTKKDFIKALGYEGKSGYSSTLGQLVNGNPSVRRLEKVADFFVVSMDTFFVRDNFKTNKHVVLSRDTVNQAEVIDQEAKCKILEQQVENLNALLTERNALITEKDKRIETLEFALKLLNK